MYDLQEDPDATSNYECLACGAIVTARARPSECDVCGRGGTFQNRALSLE